MSELELTALRLVEAAELIARRAISPLELVQAHLERIERLDKQINSFITITAEAALEKARQATERLRRSGSPPSPLFGIPIAYKDLFETKGVRTSAATQSFASYIPERDAAAVQKLEAAGAIMLGKLNMHEIALGVTNTTSYFGACHNPWNLEHITGGSSGGCAAALVSELCMGALGSDTGGSIRIPSALCGAVGLKPTYGRVSLRGVIPLSWNLDHAGPMARRTRDVAVLLQAMAGYDPLDPASIKAPVEDYSAQIAEGVRGWEIALADDEYFAQTDAEVVQAVQEAAEVFTQLGARVRRVAFPGAFEAAQANQQMVISDAAAFHRERLETQPESFEADVRQRLQTGMALPLSVYIANRRSQAELRRQFEQFFEAYDILLTPTCPVAAPPIKAQDPVGEARSLTRYTSPFNLTGLPALSLPCGFTTGMEEGIPTGLPIGLQLVGKAWGEAALLRAAYAYEQATEWHNRRPG